MKYIKRIWFAGAACLAALVGMAVAQEQDNYTVTDASDFKVLGACTAHADHWGDGGDSNGDSNGDSGGGSGC